MTVKACTPEVVELNAGDRWVFDVRVRDDNGYAGGVAPVVTVTPPTGSSVTVTPEARGDGVFRAVFTSTGSTGRYTAHVDATGYGVCDLVAYIVAPAVNGDLVTVDDVKDYVLPDVLSHTDETIQGALDTEASAQRKRCRVGAVLSPDLREALMRRVVVNLGKRVQRDTFAPDENAGVVPIPFGDPEIRRLEGPYRKVVIA